MHASPHGKNKKKRGSLGRRVSFSSEIAIRKLRRESVVEAPYEDSTGVMKSSPTAPGAEAVAPIEQPPAAVAVAPVAVASADLSINAPASPAPAIAASAFAPSAAQHAEAPSGGSPSLQELLREDALALGAADASCVSMDLTRGDMSRLVAPSPSPAAPAPQSFIAAAQSPAPAQRAVSTADLSVLTSSPFRPVRAAATAFASPRPVDDGPSLADLSLSALNSPPTAPLAQQANKDEPFVPSPAPAVSGASLLPPTSPGAALAAILGNGRADASIAEPTMDFTATLQQQLTGGLQMELTRPVGGILGDEANVANMSTASANATSDADRMLSLNSTSASVDMTLTTGGVLNHSAQHNELVPATPMSANSTQDLTAALSILRSAGNTGAVGHTMDVFSGALARTAAAATAAAPTPAEAAPAAAAEEPQATMDLTRALGGVISAAPAAADASVGVANASGAGNKSIASPSDLMAFEGTNTLELSGALVPRLLDFNAVAAPAANTGDVPMELTTAVGGLAPKTKEADADTGAVPMEFTAALGGLRGATAPIKADDTALPMALTEALPGNIITAAKEADNTAPLHTLLFSSALAPAPLPSPSPAPSATPSARGSVRQLSADEFYMRAAVRFLPVDAPAPPSLAAGVAHDPFAPAPPLADALRTAALTAHSLGVYEAAAVELAGPVLESIEGGIAEAEAHISRANPPVFRELQGGRSEALSAQQQLKTCKAASRTQARGQWARWRAGAIEAKLTARLAPLADALRTDLSTLQGRRAILRDMAFRVAAERDALAPAASAVPAESAAQAQSQRELVEQQALYKQLTALSGWRLHDIDAAGIALRWRDTAELTVRGADGAFTDVAFRVLDAAPAALRSLFNSARVAGIFAAAPSRATAALPALLQAAAVRLGRAEALLSEVRRLGGRHIAHEAPQEDSLRLLVDFSSSPSGGSNARTRFTVAFQLDAAYPFAELPFELCPHFGDVTAADVAAIVATYTSFQRLTRICADLQGIAQ